MASDHSPIEAGSHIVVWGATGAGKTTFTEAAGKALGLTVVQLDAIRHRTGWNSTDWPEFRRQLTDLLEDSPAGWITDGSYSPISDVYLSRADTVIWLHLPWRVSFWRLLRRTVARAISREPLYNPNGPTESWRLSFLSRQSILWWSISHHRDHVRTTRERLAALPASVRVYELRAPREIEAFFAAVKDVGPVVA